MARQFDLLIFDWDGTLADSTGVIVDGMQRAIRALGLAPRSDEAIRSLIGLGFREGLAELYPEHDPAALEATLMAHRSAQGEHAAHSVAPLYDGVLEVIATLHTRGHGLAVATGKSRIGLDRAIAHHAPLERAFIATRTADETATKPNPLMLFELLEECRVPAHRALMIGDTDYDIAMAEAAGVPSLAVAGGAHPAERLHAAGALGVLDAITLLPAWLEAGPLKN
ncbi:HAD-IA family hydrolase [Algiphilus sp.]|uniref:HAD-IA family hydrolase n=1 Tax=Algiphilus sp. TaxID=1872431 RepID=UPI003B529CBF